MTEDATNVKPQLSLGLYDGPTAQPQFRWTQWMNELQGTKFNRLSMHGFSDWVNPAGVFPLNADFSTNKAYIDNLAAGVDACQANNIGIEFCFFTQYAQYNKANPLNKLGIDYKDIYTNHVGADWTKKSSFKWLWYQADIHDHVTKWDSSSKAGDILIHNYVLPVIAIFKASHDSHPNRTKVWIRAFNECTTQTGEDNRVHDWFRGLFHAAGFQDGPNYKQVVNPSGTLSTDELNKCYNFARRGNYLFEIHSIDKHMDIKGDKQWMIASTDGVKDAVVTDVFTQAGKAGFPNRDHKWPDQWPGGNDLNNAFAQSMPLIQKI